jgi:hypothetical protein
LKIPLYPPRVDSRLVCRQVGCGRHKEEEEEEEEEEA